MRSNQVPVVILPDYDGYGRGGGGGGYEGGYGSGGGRSGGPRGGKGDSIFRMMF